MQSQTLKMTPNLRELRGLNVTEMLGNMPIGGSKEDGYEVEIEKERSIRSLIYQLKKLTDMRFETAKTETGIIIWRTA